MVEDKTKKGIEIRDKLGGHFEEMRALRKSIWAVHVLAHPTEFTADELVTAAEIESQMLDTYNKIESGTL